MSLEEDATQQQPAFRSAITRVQCRWQLRRNSGRFNRPKHVTELAESIEPSSPAFVMVETVPTDHRAFVAVFMRFTTTRRPLRYENNISNIIIYSARNMNPTPRYPPAVGSPIPTLKRIDDHKSSRHRKLFLRAQLHQAEINMLPLLCGRNATVIG
jgi:hypothetical protein